MPRRVYTYTQRPYYTLLNLCSTAGAFLMAAAGLVLFYNIYKTLKNEPLTAKDPWDGFTLEWYSAAAPGEKNFEALPEVKSRRPFWDLKYPDKADWRNNVEERK